jgi:Tfp pilus assembly protein PilO
MPFWLHESGVTNTFKKMPQRYKLFFTLLIPLLSALIWFCLYYMPVRRRLALKEREAVELAQQNKQLQKIAAAYDNLVRMRNELRGELAKNSFVQTSLQEIIEAVLWCMRQSGVVCRGIKQESSTTQEFFTEYCLAIEGKGEFGSILTFLHHVHQIPTCLCCESMVLHASKKQKIRMAITLRVAVVHENDLQRAPLIDSKASVVPLYANLRNPFVMSSQKTLSAQQAVVLEGIVSAGETGTASALMSCGGLREIVALGDIFHGYRLASIDKTSVVLTKGKTRRKLTVE